MGSFSGVEYPYQVLREKEEDPPGRRIGDS
jgi:hypothetical protein